MSSLYGDMNLDGTQDLFPVGEQPQHQETATATPEPATAFNTIANALIDPIAAAEQVLSPENIAKSKIPFEWAVVGVTIIVLIWVNSWMGDKKR